MVFYKGSSKGKLVSSLKLNNSMLSLEYEFIFWPPLGLKIVLITERKKNQNWFLMKPPPPSFSPVPVDTV